jgi:hypothetical protein
MNDRKQFFKRDFRRVYTATEQVSGNKSRSGGPDARDREKISVNEKNFKSVLQEHSSDIQIAFEHYAEALLELRVPNAFRELAKAEGFWLDEKKNTANSEPEKEKKKSVLEALYESRKVELEKDLVNAESNLVEYSSNLTFTSKKDKKIERLELDIHSIQRDIRDLKKSLNDLKIKESMKEAENFQKYVGKCHAMIGTLKALCVPELIRSVQNNPAYITASQIGDLVQVAHIIKSHVMNTDSSKIQDERERRSEAFKKYRFVAGKMKFLVYADNIATMYTEFAECCDGGAVPESDEHAFVRSILHNTKQRFWPVTMRWFGENPEGKPSTVESLMAILKSNEREHNLSTMDISGQPDDFDDSEAHHRASSNIVRKKALRTTMNPEELTVFDTKRIACKNLSTSNYCKYGADCKFSHEIHNNTPSKGNNMPDANDNDLCQFVVKYGNCKKGDNCFKALKHYDSLIKYHKDQALSQPRSLA